MRIIQALWPAILTTFYAFGLAVQREWEIAIPLVVCSSWCVCAFLLNPVRKWSWWVCLTPVAFCALAGLICFGSLAHMAIFPEYWATANQPGAIAILGGLFFLGPSTLLLLHLFAIRHRFYDSSIAQPGD
jgi:hypothetical protein